MNVTVRLFAVLRERADADSVEIEVPDGATVRDAIEEVSKRPGLRDPIAKMKIVMAVNREYAHMDVVLHAGDELALIPPVSGGATAARSEPRTEWGRRFWAAVDGTGPRPPCAQLLGWNPLEMEPGRTRIEFQAIPEFANPAGVVQGGFLAAMLDDTMGPGAVAAHGGDAFTPTLELKVSFLKPAYPGKLIGEGRIVHMGRSILFLAGSLNDEDGNVVATATATSRLLKFKAEDGNEADLGIPSDVLPAPAHDQPPNADFIELVSNKTGGVPESSRLLGSWPLEAEPGRVRIEFHAGRQFLNPRGVVQGGFLAAMLDGTMGPAGFTLLEPGFFDPTLELKTSFLRPAHPGKLIAEATVVHSGRSIIFTEATLEDEAGQLVAAATGTARIASLKKPSAQ